MISSSLLHHLFLLTGGFFFFIPTATQRALVRSRHVFHRLMQWRRLDKRATDRVSRRSRAACERRDRICCVMQAASREKGRRRHRPTDRKTRPCLTSSCLVVLVVCAVNRWTEKRDLKLSHPRCKPCLPPSSIRTASQSRLDLCIARLLPRESPSRDMNLNSMASDTREQASPRFSPNFLLQ